jgi:hypothetical protein
MEGGIVRVGLIAVIASALIAVFAAALLAVIAAALKAVVAFVTVVGAAVAVAAAAGAREKAHLAFHESNELWGRPALRRRSFSTLGVASRMLAAGVRQC